MGERITSSHNALGAENPLLFEVLDRIIEFVSNHEEILQGYSPTETQAPSSGSTTVRTTVISDETYWTRAGNALHPTDIANWVGIGTTAPTDVLHVHSVADAITRVRVDNPGPGTRTQVEFYVVTSEASSKTFSLGITGPNCEINFGTELAPDWQPVTDWGYLLAGPGLVGVGMGFGYGYNSLQDSEPSASIVAWPGGEVSFYWAAIQLGDGHYYSHPTYDPVTEPRIIGAIQHDGNGIRFYYTEWDVTETMIVDEGWKTLLFVDGYSASGNMWEWKTSPDSIFFDPTAGHTARIGIGVTGPSPTLYRNVYILTSEIGLTGASGIEIHDIRNPGQDSHRTEFVAVSDYAAYKHIELGIYTVSNPSYANMAYCLAADGVVAVGMGFWDTATNPEGVTVYGASLVFYGTASARTKHAIGLYGNSIFFSPDAAPHITSATVEGCLRYNRDYDEMQCYTGGTPVTGWKCMPWMRDTSSGNIYFAEDENVYIGQAPPFSSDYYRLVAYYNKTYNTTPSYTYAFQGRSDVTVTGVSTGTWHQIGGFYGVVTLTQSYAGTTTGYMYAIYASALLKTCNAAARRDNYTAGIDLYVGHDTGAALISDEVYGIQIHPYWKAGTISDFRALYIVTALTGGSVTNKWGIYVDDYTMKNRFLGPVLIGTSISLYNYEELFIYGSWTASSGLQYASRVNAAVVFSGGSTAVAGALLAQIYPDVTGAAGSAIGYGIISLATFDTDGGGNTLGALYGLAVQYGTSETATSVALSETYGLIIRPYHRKATSGTTVTIGTSYALVITAPVAISGYAVTPSYYYAIYQADSNADNIFYGNSGFGAGSPGPTWPVEDVHAIDTVRSDQRFNCAGVDGYSPASETTKTFNIASNTVLVIKVTGGVVTGITVDGV